MVWRFQIFLCFLDLEFSGCDQSLLEEFSDTVCFVCHWFSVSFFHWRFLSFCHWFSVSFFILAATFLVWPFFLLGPTIVGYVIFPSWRSFDGKYGHYCDIYDYHYLIDGNVCVGVLIRADHEGWYTTLVVSFGTDSSWHTWEVELLEYSFRTWFYHCA